jgi:hypothetical protein
MLGVAMASALLVNVAAKPPKAGTACVFQALIRVGQEQPPNGDFITFTNKLASSEVITADFVGVFRTSAQKLGVKPGTYAPAMGPASGLATFQVRVIGPDKQGVISLANSMCDEFVARIKKQRTDQVAADIDAVKRRLPPLQAELKKLQAIPPKNRSAIDNVALVSQLAALRGNALVIARLLSLPPSQIAVVTRASEAQRLPVSHSRPYLLALVGALLASFLYILIGEVMRDQRARGPWQSAPDLETIRDPDATARR